MATPSTSCELPSCPEPRGIKPCSTSPTKPKDTTKHNVFKITKRQLVKASEPSQPRSYCQLASVGLPGEGTSAPRPPGAPAAGPAATACTQSRSRATACCGGA